MKKHIHASACAKNADTIGVKCLHFIIVFDENLIVSSRAALSDA